MAAFLRSAVASHISNGTGTAARGDAKPGDILLAFQSSDSGGLGFLTGDWEPLGVITGGAWPGTTAGVWAGTQVMMRIVAADEPDGYGASGGPVSDGIVTIAAIAGALADSVVVVLGSNGSPVAPGVTPGFVSGIQLRYGAAVPSPPGGSVSWPAIPGLTQRTQLQGNIWTTAALHTATVASNAPLAAVHLSPSPQPAAAHAFTVLIASKTVEVPTPPSFPSFTPVKGLLRMQYRVHDALTGSYRGELRSAQDVTFDRRDGDAGAFTCFAPMPSRREADRVARMIPRDPRDLDSGPGRLVVHPWRDGVLWGVYVLHTAEIEKTSKLGLGLRLQGTTLDGYMNSVSVEEDVFFGGEQIDNARELIAMLGQDPRSNMGFTLMPGSSGLVRELTARQADNTTYGRLLRDYARADGGFGYVINPTVTDQGIQRLWVWGSPRLDFPLLKVTFTESPTGGQVTDWREVRSILRGGTRWGAVGGTPQGDATETREAVRTALIETPHLAAGWPIWDQRPIHPGGSTDMTELDLYAAYYAATAAGAPRVFSANVILGRSSKFHPNMIGGYVRFLLNNDWHVPTADGGSSFAEYQRIIGWALTPATRTYGKDKLQIITETPGIGA